jgi:hypothetical protein
MWDILVRAPLGRNNQRKFVTFLTTVLVACFVYIFATAPPAYAADAAWENSFIVYEGDSYEGEFVAKPGDGTGLADGTKYYLYVEPSAPNVVTRKAHVIYFAPGADPPTETSAKIAEYTSVRGKLSDKKNEKTISIEPDANASSSTNPGTTSCAIEGIGWIVCPVTNFLAKGMDVIYGYIDGFLEVRPLATTQDQAMYRAWSYMRDFANVLFVIGFLIIVYAQITGGVISNYTIKKILPRVVIAAILVNISYWICALAIDFFNILGYSVQDLFIQMRNTLVGSEGNSWQVINVESLTALILSGGTIVAGGGIAAFLGITTAAGVIAGGGIGGLVILLVPLLLGLLFIVLMTFLILAARQAIITILVIISPLAFVAYLLPNTEKWFDKWRDTFITLLFVFPAFSVVFAGAQLASAVIIQNAKDVNTILLALAVQLAPLAITPLLLKLGGGVLNRFAGVVNNPSKGIFDRGKNWARDRTEANKSAGLAELARRAKDRGFAGGRASGNNGRRNSSGMHPYNMAFNRDQRRREREGMKAANESMSDGLFTQTARGRRVYDRNEDASGEKHFGENQNFRDYKQAMATGADAQNTYRRDLHHQAHVAKGIGDVYEDSMAKHAEQDLQVTIRDTPNLRAVKDATAVHAGLAEEAKKVVDASGELALRQTIEQSVVLKQQAADTVAIQKQAEAFGNITKNDAEAAWDTHSRTDQAMQRLRLRDTESSEKAKLAEQRWNSVIEEAKAKGYTSPSVDNANTVIADNLQALTRDLSAEEKRVESAKVVQRTNLVEAFSSDDALRTYVGGVDGVRGATRVYAQAKEELVNEAVKEVKTNRALTSELSRDQLKTMMFDRLDARGNQITTEMQQAAMYELLEKKGNNQDAQEIRDAVAKMGVGMDSQGNYFEYERDNAGRIIRDPQTNRPVLDMSQPISDQNEIGGRRDWQQFFMDASKNSPHSMVTLSGTNRSEAESGMLIDDIRYSFMRDARDGKFGPEKILKADIDELKTLHEDMQNPNGEYNRLNPAGKAKFDQAFENAVIDLQNHPTYAGQIDDRSRGVMNDILADINPTYDTGQRDASGNRVFNVGDRNQIVSAGTPSTRTFTTPIHVSANRPIYTNRTIRR